MKAFKKNGWLLRQLPLYVVLLLSFFSIGATGRALAQNPQCNLYVDPKNGVDFSAANDGSTFAKAFQSLSYASTKLFAGSVLCLADTQAYTSTGSNIMTITAHGTSQQNPIVIQPMPGASPVLALQSTNFQGILITPAPGEPPPAYITIQGLTIAGNRYYAQAIDNGQCSRNVTIRTIDNLPCSYNATIGSPGPSAFPGFNDTCIYINGAISGSSASTPRPHHITISDNTLHDCNGSGVEASESDYIFVQYNTLYSNGYYTAYGSSALGIINAWNSSTDGGIAADPFPGSYAPYRIVIDQNQVLDTQEKVGWSSFIRTDSHGIDNAIVTDGEGIILDTNNNATVLDKAHLSSYDGQILISNNLVFMNGSSGIEILNSNNAQVLNNSLFGNATNYQYGDSAYSGYSQYANGEIQVNGTNGTNVYNNIFEPNPNTSQFGQNAVNVVAGSYCGCYFAYNDFYNGNSQSIPSGSNVANIGNYPSYVTWNTTDMWSINLRLTPNSSPLLGAGETWALPPHSFSNGPQVNSSGKRDIGAWQQ